jgi:SAM-dependent methyltransferase
VRFRGHAASAAFFTALVLGAQTQVQQVEINAPYLETPDSVVTAMLKLAGVNSKDIVYDLGCGDGRIVIAAARDFGARGVGIDIAAPHIDDARALARSAGVAHKVHLAVGDIFTTDIRDATVVALYLLPDLNLKLRPRLLRELKPGTRIVSHAFDMGDWKPDRIEVVDGSRIFLWTVPEKN